VSDLEDWVRHLRLILDATADTKRTLDIAENAVGISDAIHGGAANATAEGLPRIVQLVRAANAIGARLGELELAVPGDAPEVDLRPWWSRLLERVSSTARRNTVGQQLETLRLEADAAVQRAVTRRAAPGSDRA
jgi:hypothetical protein